MDGLERFRRTLAFQPCDRPAVVAQVFAHAALVCGRTIEEYRSSAAVAAECQLAALARYGYDAVFAVLDLALEAEAVGGGVQRHAGCYPAISRPPYDLDADFAQLPIPDPRHAGRLPMQLDMTRRLRAALGDRAVVVGLVQGPMTLAVQFLGMERALFLAADEPECFLHLLDHATRVAEAFGLAQLEAGAHLVMVFDPAGCPEVVPAGMFREMIGPCLARLFAAFKQAGAEANWLHVAGRTAAILPSYRGLGADIGNFDYCVDAERLLATLGEDRLCLDGNIKPLAFVTASPAEIEAEARRLLRLFERRGGFILSSGCEIPPEARSANVAALVRAATEWTDGGRHGDPRHIGVRLRGEGDDAVRRIAFAPGASLRDILNRTSVPVHSACSGIGACGLCRVRIDTGDAGAPSTAEVLHLGDERLAAHIRLACQVIPGGDLDVTVLRPARPSPWRIPALPPYLSHYPLTAGAAGDQARLGVAIDLGTTHITVAICDLARGRRLGVRCGLNPQSFIGADVISRLRAATKSADDARELRRLAVDAIGAALLDLSRREGITLPAVAAVRVVGNTAMLALLAGGSAELLLDPGQWLSPFACRLSDSGALAQAWNLGLDTDIRTIQPLGGFVGSDLLAGIVHCRMTEAPLPALLVDFGTNTEIALWDGARLWVTAAAGGPAFEGVGIGCGMAAESGAIRHLVRGGDGAWRGEVIDGAPAAGICGSGLVDLLAVLRETGEIDECGRPIREPLTISVDGTDFTLSKGDIDALQQAKAAIAAGIDVLCRRAGLGCDRIGTIHVAGSFGEHLDFANAKRIGLLPPVAADRVRLAGNTALHGAIDLLLSDAAEATLALARPNAKLINLSLDEDFAESFFDHLYLRAAAIPG